MKIETTTKPSTHWEFTRFVLLVYFITVAAMLGLYASTFGLNISDQHDRWGQFGDFMGGILNPLTSLFTLFVAILVWKLQTKELAETRTSLQEQNRLNSFAVADQTLARYFDAIHTSISGVYARTRSSGISGESDKELTGDAAIKEFMGFLKNQGLLFWNDKQQHTIIESTPLTTLAVEQLSPLRSAVTATIQYIERTYSYDNKKVKYELLRISLPTGAKLALCYLVWLESDSKLLNLIRQSELLSDFPAENIKNWIEIYKMQPEI
jgi:hypothetical protein